MRVLHLANHCRMTGSGIVNVMVDLACQQAGAGHEVTIASSGGSFEPLLAAHGVRHHRLSEANTPRNRVRRLVEIPSLLRSHRPDIVHAHDMTNAVSAFLSKPVAGRLKLVTTVHNIHDPTSRLMGLADRVIAVSHGSVPVLRRWRIPARKIRVVVNGTLGSPRYDFGDAQQPIPDFGDGPTVLTVAGMQPRKGIPDLVEAFNLAADVVRDARLVVVGTGPQKEAYEAAALATRHGDRIRFVGFHPAPHRYMERAEVFALASYREAWGLVLTEARAAGCAVVSTAVDGTVEALDGGAAGLLVPPGDPPAMAAALVRLLTSPEELRRWREAAQQNLEAYAIARVAEEVLAVYREALGPAGAEG